jgi:hypothetical protein
MGTSHTAFLLEETDVAELSPEDRMHIRRKKIGLMGDAAQIRAVLTTWTTCMVTN